MGELGQHSHLLVCCGLGACKELWFNIQHGQGYVCPVSILALEPTQSLVIGYWTPFPGRVKQPGCEVYHLPYLVVRVRMSETSPSMRSWCLQEQLCVYEKWTQESIRSGSLYQPTNALCDTTHDKLLHVSAPSCYHGGITTQVYKPTYQYTPCTSLLQ